MTWIYHQKTGKLISETGVLVAIGYSGRVDGKNNPVMQNVKDVGPIPQGNYQIHGPVDTVTHGPYVLPLEPEPLNEMFGRQGFLIHGDSVVHPGTASEGCIIMPRQVREQVWESMDHYLSVES